MTHDPTGATVDDLIRYMVKGDAEAFAFVRLLFAVAHLWDDAVDGDKPADTDSMMYGALVVLPRDPFYQRHFALLNPLVEIASINWLAANVLESTDSADDKHISFVIRSDYFNVALMAARIVGGFDWVREVAVHARRKCHIEGFAGYLENLRAQFAAAKKEQPCA